MSAFLIVLPLIIIICLGNFMKYKGFYTNIDVKSLTKTLFWIIMPALLYRATFISGKEILNQPGLLKGSHLAYVITIILVWIFDYFIFYKKNTPKLATSVMAAIRGNNIYLGFPLVYLTMGDLGLEKASIYIAVTTIGYQLLSIGGGNIALTEKLDYKSIIFITKRLVKNPQVLACFVGVMSAVVGIERLPIPIDESLKILGSAASAMALLMIGASINFTSLNHFLKMLKNTLWDVLVRLIFHPVFMYACLSFFNVPRILLQVTVLISAMPTAVNVFVFASEMGMDGEHGAELVVMSTLISAFTIPAWIKILEIV